MQNKGNNRFIYREPEEKILQNKEVVDMETNDHVILFDDTEEDSSQFIGEE